ncbi:MAG TPA: methyltransferase domain-containing protein [Rhodopila sp.]|jgi:SAM-dependent methyltransferase|nr:methyltransferase domain-containing protein [Rhodopila sp.]
MSASWRALAQRSDQPEQMDTDCVDFADYRRCLRDLSRVNIVTMTHRPMLSWLTKRAGGDFSLLDVACGYGDALRRIRRRFPNARLTGIDLNPWATRAAEEATDPAARIQFINGDAFAYQPPEKFDFIITSQFTHHLTNEQVVGFLRWLQQNAGQGWFIGDVHRHAIAYYGFPILARLAFWHHFVRTDGQISIARSFVRPEWQALLREAGLTEQQAFVAWYIPFRLCVGTR